MPDPAPHAEPSGASPDAPPDGSSPHRGKADRKLPFQLLVGCVFLVPLLVLGSWLFVDPLGKAAVTTAGTSGLGVTTALNTFRFSLLGGRVDCEELELRNPAGFAPERSLLHVGAFTFDVRPLGILRDEIEIEEFTAEDVSLNLECHVAEDYTSIRTNVQRLLENLPALADAVIHDDPESTEPSAEPDPKPAPAEDPGVRLKVGKVKVAGVSAALRFRGAIEKDLTLELPPFELSGLSTPDGQGLPIPEFIGRIIESAAEEALAQGVAQLGDALKARLAAALEGLAADLAERGVEAVAKDLEGSAASAAEAAKEAAGETGGELIKSGSDAVRGLFGGDD